MRMDGVIALNVSTSTHNYIICLTDGIKLRNSPRKRKGTVILYKSILAVERSGEAAGLQRPYHGL
jgi:hypothetical protein